MKKLFLASSFKDVADILISFESELNNKRITFIPTASTVESVRFYVGSGKKALMKLGLIVDELDVSIASSDEIESKLKHNDFIYITGGNTFFLLQELKRTGADKLIVEQVEAGKLYIGESAGAMIASPNIEYAKHMDSVKKGPDLTSFDALALANFYTVPHYINPPFKKAAEKIIATYSPTHDLMPISNKEAILVYGDKIVTKGS